MARPTLDPGVGTAIVSIRLPLPLRAKVDQVAADLGITPSEVIRRAIELLIGTEHEDLKPSA